ncbi:MAG TPA: flagellar biosynthesis anti-sigma factor FlgM [Bdellovibrionota bacterium]|nr:flagellar biosynthesis anti-sigma factor FlgM [Bdellovibrionota bacterium]
MEIKKSNANQVGAAQISEQSKLQKKSVDANATSSTKQAVSSSGDRVEISSDATVMAQGLDQIKNTPDVRADRVAELKKAIQSGTYKVDARKIADKMVDSSLEEAILLGRKNS